MDEAAAREELFAAALDAFVETRARLGAALIAAGHKTEGQALKKVRRPSPSAWATNQVVRRARAEVEAFLAASDRLRGSQGAIVAGRGDRGLYQADVEDLRQATAALATATRRVLAELGRADDRSIVERVVANARAAALTETAREAVLGGALLVDVDGGAEGFGGLLANDTNAAAPAATKRPIAPRPVAAPAARARQDEAAARRRDDEREAARRDDEREAARRDEVTAREAAAAAKAVAAQARAALDEARRRLDEAQRMVRDAERALGEADAAHRGADRDAAEADTRAGRATRRRESLDE